MARALPQRRGRFNAGRVFLIAQSTSAAPANGTIDGKVVAMPKARMDQRPEGKHLALYSERDALFLISDAIGSPYSAIRFSGVLRVVLPPSEASAAAYGG